MFSHLSPSDMALLTSLNTSSFNHFSSDIFQIVFGKFLLLIIAHLSRGQSNAWKFSFALAVLPVWKAHN